jgi:hypothetical protein
VGAAVGVAVGVAVGAAVGTEVMRVQTRSDVRVGAADSQYATPQLLVKLHSRLLIQTVLTPKDALEGGFHSNSAIAQEVSVMHALSVTAGTVSLTSWYTSWFVMNALLLQTVALVQPRSELALGAVL